ncbi:hypothetical protein R6Q59_016551 [Mikania micrantha]
MIGGDRRTLRHESPAIGDSRSLGGTIGVEDGREGGVNCDCLGTLQRSHERVKLRLHEFTGSNPIDGMKA